LSFNTTKRASNVSARRGMFSRNAVSWSTFHRRVGALDASDDTVEAGFPDKVWIGATCGNVSLHDLRW
jgi:hypothetical protein